MLLLLLSTILLGASFVLPQLGWLVFIALVPLLLWAERTPWGNKRMVLAVWLAGTVFFLFNLLWLRETAPGSWPGLEGPALTLALHFGWVVMTLTYSLQFAVFGWVLARLRGRLLSATALVALPLVMAIAEFGRSYLFSLVAWGPGGTLGPHWNFGSLGLAASSTPLIYAGRFIGLFGLSALVVVINMIALHLIRRHYRAGLLLLPVAAAVLLAFYMYPANGRTLNIAVVSLAPLEDSKYGERLAELLAQQPLQTPADIAVLPEYSFFYAPDMLESHQRVLPALFGDRSGTLLLAGSEYSGSSRYNQIIFRRSDGQNINVQNKHFLINGGELMPVAVDALMKTLGHGEISDAFNKRLARTPGNEPETPVTVSGTRVGALACSGIISAELYRDIANKGAELLTNSASVGNFATTPSFYLQTEQMARFDTVANARPFAQAAKGGHSFILDSNGNTLYRSSKPELAVAERTVTTSSARTPYTNYGEWIIPVGIAALGGLWVRHLIRRKAA